MESVQTDIDVSHPTWAPPRAPMAPEGYDPDAVREGAAPAGLPSVDQPVKLMSPAPRRQSTERPEQLLPPGTPWRQWKYEPGALYLSTGSHQNIPTLFQGSTDNGNWVRGGAFGNDYSVQEIWGRPARVEEGLPEKPTTLANVVPSHFYPYPSFFDRYDRQYKTYPHNDNYYRTLPFYTYPYPGRDRIPNAPIEKTEQQLLSSSSEETKEHFAPYPSSLVSPINLTSLVVVASLMGILLIMIKR